jgi:hypothetical protein
VFFATDERLVSEDFDSGYDMYDAHACSAQSPCIAPPPVLPPECSTGDSCKAAPSPQPSVFGSPASATFAGAGNVVAGSLERAATTRSLTRSQLLARALRACRKQKAGQRRVACEQSTLTCEGASGAIYPYETMEIVIGLA